MQHDEAQIASAAYLKDLLSQLYIIAFKAGFVDLCFLIAVAQREADLIIKKR